LFKLGPAAVVLGLVIAALAPSFAGAAPQLDVSITHTPTTMPRNDEQLTYEVGVKNVAPANPSEGDTLTCDGVPAAWGGSKNWFGKPTAKLTFKYQWVGNGAPIPGASGSVSLGGPLPTHTVTVADGGKAIQCVITATVEATNPSESMSHSVASQPPVVVSPVPSPPPPGASEPTNANSRPTIEVVGGGTAAVGKELKCKPPAGWSGAPTWMSFGWLRNGSSIATGETYVVVAADEKTEIQCEVIGATGTGEAPGGGAAMGISSNVTIGAKPVGVETAPNNGLGQTPVVQFPNSTSGEAKLEFELPAGGGTRAFAVSTVGGAGEPNWSCSATEPAPPVHAAVNCTSTEVANPQGQYRRVKVLTSVGPDAPDPLIAVATVSGGGSGPDSASDGFHFLPPTPFGIKDFTTQVSDALGADYTQAGGHAFSANASFSLNTRVLNTGNPGQVEFLRDIVTDLPPGFVGNPQAAPQICETTEAVQNDTFADPTCPRASIVGGVTVEIASGSDNHELTTGWPLYLVRPERGVPAQLVFYIQYGNALFSLTPRLRPADGYAISVDSPAASKNPPLLAASVTLCGYGANVQEGEAGHFHGAPQVTSCKKSTDAGANSKPFLTNPTACSETAPVTKLSVDSWENPGVFTSKEAVAPKVTGCEKVPFNPSIDLRPTSHQADSPTGLDVSLSVPTDGLESPNGIAQGYLKRAVVTLPKGMAVNPAAANGLGACTPAEIGLGTNDPVRCPDSSKVGSALIKTPILAESLEGSVYIAKQGENPFGSLLALYLVAESKERGILVKLPGHVEPQLDGQIRASFDNNPQAPISSVDLHFNSGNRAALLNPPTCGTYQIVSELSPWSAKDPDNPTEAEIRKTTSNFDVTSGPGGGPCPSGDLAPKLRAGLQNPVAGSKSPFALSLSREDGSQRFSALDVKLPPGLVGSLRGVQYCADAILAGIPSNEGSGVGQLAAPSCPAASLLGSVSVGAGGGSNPFYVDTGRAYLAGPYRGAPVSIAIVTPAVAGPFDLGNVVVRSAAYVDSETGQITVKSDPIPTILDGIPLDVRDIRVDIDRPGFMQAPTNCEPMSVDARVQGEKGASAAVSDRFQVGECAALGFAPRLQTRLFGGTRRGANPRLRAVVDYTANQANIKRVGVTLPHSEFLEQSHIQTICTRVQFAQGACPAGSVYGYAKAFSPLVNYAVEGPVYLRSSSHPLPDLVMALHGLASQPIELDLVGRIDSVNGGIRTSFETVPDLPVSRFVLEMKGGKKGLLVNSRDICKSVNRSTVRMDGQNGMTHDFRPVLANDCGKKKPVHRKARTELENP
jgi:hypothetical protein